MKLNLLNAIILTIVVTIVGGTGCGSSNILVDFGSETDESLLFGAKQLMNKGLWDDAITNFGSMSAEYLERRDVKFSHANAYAGRCGLNFMSFIESLANIGVSPLFLFLMQAYPAATIANGADCAQAEALIKSISTTVTERTVDENTFMAFMSFTKIGVYLSAKADTDGDGAPDGAFDSCLIGSISDDEMREVGTGLANALTSLSGPGVSLGGGQVSDMTTICSDIVANLGATFDFCSSVNKVDITADQLRAIRIIVGEGQAIGIGSCAAVPDSIANCPCP